METIKNVVVFVINKNHNWIQYFLSTDVDAKWESNGEKLQLDFDAQIEKWHKYLEGDDISPMRSRELTSNNSGKRDNQFESAGILFRTNDDFYCSFKHNIPEQAILEGKLMLNAHSDKKIDFDLGLSRIKFYIDANPLIKEHYPETKPFPFPEECK